MGPEETLGGKFYDGLEVSHDVGSRDHIFAVGFYTGQMEKVFSGACLFCMLRPYPQDQAMLGPVIYRLAGKFGLITNFLESEGEYWVGQADHQGSFERMKNMEVISKAWHYLRASMCGIPCADPKYHLREGHKQNPNKKTLQESK